MLLPVHSSFCFLCFVLQAGQNSSMLANLPFQRGTPVFLRLNVGANLSDEGLRPFQQGQLCGDLTVAVFNVTSRLQAATC